MDKININVLGCCVSRDTLDYNVQTGNFDDDKYNVVRYTSNVSPYIMLIRLYKAIQADNNRPAADFAAGFIILKFKTFS